jgi:hypothetical protein
MVFNLFLMILRIDPQQMCLGVDENVKLFVTHILFLYMALYGKVWNVNKKKIYIYIEIHRLSYFVE